MPLTYDLILKGGEIIDPAQDLHAKRDIAFKDGKVAALSNSLPQQEAARVIDVSSKLVTPGLIDLHGHYAYRIQPRRVDPDPTCLGIGNTTAVDAGTTGFINFDAFRNYIIDRVETRIYSFIHLGALGISTTVTLGIPDLEDFRWAREEETAQCIEDNRDIVLGVKVRLSPSGTTDANAVPALEMARRIADQTRTKFMVHVMESPLPLAQVFSYLQPGDIATHIYHGDTHSVLDADGRIRPEAWDAYNSGVIFDTAGAMRHFSLPVCRAVVEGGMPPHTISTDRVGPRPNAVNYNLLDHMAIFLELGMSMDEVVRAVTTTPAASIGRADLGNLKVGSIGDAAVLDLQDGEFRFEDGLNNTLSASRHFAHVLTVKDGKRWRPRL